MPNHYHLLVVAEHGKVFEGDVVEVGAPGLVGSFGVLSRHAPILAGLGTGELLVRVEKDREPIKMAIAGGVLEFRADNTALVLTRAAERADDIDVARAREAAERAKRRLAGGTEIDADRARAALSRAINRLHVAGAPPPA